MTNLIIDKPHWQTRGQRVVFGSVTLVFWAVWIYLWLPILGFVGWLLGVRLAYDQMIIKGGYVGLLHLLGIYALIILALGASLLIWAYYNYFRFRGVDRRAARPPVSVINLSERYQFPAETLDRWITARRLVLHHNQEGRLIGAD
jgi:biofilm PGA synthesis protein PgaD